MIQALISIVGRFLLCFIFLMSAIANKIPNFNETVAKIAAENAPFPALMLYGGILFLVLGSLSVMTGCKTRVGAGLLLAFLVLATYYFHDFWNFEDGPEQQLQMISFMKNVALSGAMIFLIANGGGAGTVDSLLAKKKAGEDGKEFDE